MKRFFSLKLDALRSDRYQVTAEGYLVCPAAVTRAGVFDYNDDAGNLVRELRSAEEVFSPASLATLQMVPITFMHPDELVTVDNIKTHQVGSTGEKIEHDAEFVTCTVKITDKQVVAYVLDRHAAGKDVELSCGYEAEVEPVSGEHPTEGHYDAVQKNIRYNHLSIVPAGRAGAQVKLKLDHKEKSTMFNFIRKALKLDGFTMDAIEAEVPQEAKGILDRLSTKLDEAVEVIRDKAGKILELTKKSDELQAKLDTAAEEVKKLKADNALLADPAGEKIQAIIADRKALETVAQKLSIKTDGLTDQAVKLAVIAKQTPDFKSDGKSADYVNARYDAVVELLDAAEKEGGTTALAAVIRDASQAGSQAKVDHRGEFIKKSRELGDK